MFVRSALAAIDHNLNTGREQKTTAQGTLCFDLVKTRHAKKYQVKAVKVAKDTSWRNGLASLTVKVYKSLWLNALIFQIQFARTGTKPSVSIPLGEDLPRVRKQIEKPDKLEAIRSHQSRFL